MRPMERLAARLLSMGKNYVETAEACGVSTQTIKNWEQKPLFQEHVEKLMEERFSALEEVLLDGEQQAVLVLMDALKAVRLAGQKGNRITVPDWKTRLAAAFRLLDAAGKRGKPVERVQSQHTEISGDITEALTAALRDPGVQKFMKEQKILLLPEEIVSDVEFETVPDED